MDNTRILGDGTKKSRFNSRLADQLNKDAEKYSIKEKYSSNASSMFWTEQDKVMTQDEWMNYWKKHDKVRVMASMSDYYHAAQSGNHELMKQLRYNFDNFGIVAREWILFTKEFPYITIMDYHADKKRHLSKLNGTISIPVYNGIPINDVLSNTTGLTFIQTLFHTGNSRGRIMDTLEDLSGKSLSDIVVCTPNTGDRFLNPSKVAFMSYDGLANQKELFYITLCGNQDVRGASYGLKPGAWRKK